MLMFMDGWETGLLFSEFHHQMTASSSKLPGGTASAANKGKKEA